MQVHVSDVESALQASFAEDTEPFEILVNRLVELGKQRVAAKLLKQFLERLGERQKGLKAYIHPLVIEKVPDRLSLTELAGELDILNFGATASGERMITLRDGRTTFPAPELLLPGDGDPISASAGPFESFLSDGSQSLFLLLGESGSGKSSFKWHFGKLREAEFRSVHDGLMLMLGVTTWIPVCIHLQKYKRSEVKGMLRRHLQEECKLSERELNVVWKSFGSHAPESSAYRLLVFCDDFDELREEESSESGPAHPLADGGATDTGKFASEVLSSPDGELADAKVVVTCKEGFFNAGLEEEGVFGPCCRRVILPLLSSRIKTYITDRISVSDPAMIQDWDTTSVDGSSSFARLSPEDYFSAMQQSVLLRQVCRNAFILSMFVDTLPLMWDSNRKSGISAVNRFSIYSTFVRQHIRKSLRTRVDVECDAMLKELMTAGGPDREKSRDELINAIVELCGVIAMEMERSNRMPIELGSEVVRVGSAWSRVCEAYFSLDQHRVDGLKSSARQQWDTLLPNARFDLECRQFTKETFAERAVQDAYRLRRFALGHASEVCPLQKTNVGYAFLHESLYEYFVWLKSSGLSRDDILKACVRSDVTAGVLEFPVLRVRKGRKSQEKYTAVCIIGDGSSAPGVSPCPCFFVMFPKVC